MSHWSSGLAICFLPQGAVVHSPGVQPTLWNWDYLLALPCYTAYFLEPALQVLFRPGGLRFHSVCITRSLTLSDYCSACWPTSVIFTVRG
jgi:hypothetical protein